MKVEKVGNTSCWVEKQLSKRNKNGGTDALVALLKKKLL
jgi:hypothetical protein